MFPYSMYPIYLCLSLCTECTLCTFICLDRRSQTGSRRCRFSRWCDVERCLAGVEDDVYIRESRNEFPSPSAWWNTSCQAVSSGEGNLLNVSEPMFLTKITKLDSCGLCLDPPSSQFLKKYLFIFSFMDHLLIYPWSHEVFCFSSTHWLLSQSINQLIRMNKTMTL